MAVGEAAAASATIDSVPNPELSVATGEGRTPLFSGEAASSCDSIDCLDMNDSTMTDGLLDKFRLEAHDLMAIGGGASLATTEVDRRGDSGSS